MDYHASRQAAPPRAWAVYARKSHDDTDVTQKSLDDQLTALAAVAKERGLDVVLELRESKSAKDPGQRPAFKDLMARIGRGQIDGILVWHVNRLARNMDEGGKVVDLLGRGIIKEIRTPSEVYRPEDNLLPLIIQMGTATQNNRDHTVVVMRGAQSKFEAGGWNHRAPAGYLNSRDAIYTKRGTVVTDPERFAALRQGWELLLTGGYSVEAVIEALNERGFRTRPTQKRGGAPLSRSHGYKIFRDPFYAGYVRRGSRLLQGQHPPMVSAAEFERVQAIIQARGKTRTRQEFAFTGLMRCAECGQGVTASRVSKGDRKYVYYHCSDSFKRCTRQSRREDRVEADITGLLDSLILPEELCRIAIENIERWLKDNGAQTEKAAAMPSATLEQTQTQLKTLLDLRLRGVLSDDDLYAQKEAELLAQRDRLRLGEQRAQAEATLARENARRAGAVLAFSRSFWAVADADEKRELARGFGTSYRLRAGELEAEPQPLLVELAAYARSLGEGGANGSGSNFGTGPGRTPSITPLRSSQVKKSVFKPLEIGSGKSKSFVLQRSFSTGRTEGTELKPVQPGNRGEITQMDGASHAQSAALLKLLKSGYFAKPKLLPNI